MTRKARKSLGITLAKGARSQVSRMPCTLTVFAETAEMELTAGGGMGDVADEIKSSCARSNLLVPRGERAEQRRGFVAARAARQGRSRWRWLIAGAFCYAAPLMTALRAAGGSEAGNAGAEMPLRRAGEPALDFFQKHASSLARQDGSRCPPPRPSADDADGPVREPVLPARAVRVHPVRVRRRGG